MSKKLLFSVTKKDFEIQTFRSGGKGGQKQNKTESGVRIIHKASGARGESRNERSQVQNKKIAFHRLIDSKEFQLWLRKKASSLSVNEDLIKQMVDKNMKSDNLKVEVQDNNKWVEEND